MSLTGVVVTPQLPWSSLFRRSLPVVVMTRPITGPPTSKPDTDIASDPVGDTDVEGDSSGGSVPPAKVCRTSPADSTPGQTVLWLCDGFASAKQDLDTDEAGMIEGVKDELSDITPDVLIDQIVKLVDNLEHCSDTEYVQFGPHCDDDAAENETVVACCQDGRDYLNTVQPDDRAWCPNMGKHAQSTALTRLAGALGTNSYGWVTRPSRKQISASRKMSETILRAGELL